MTDIYEAYPSIARSLDKIVDKMEGNAIFLDPPIKYTFTYNSDFDGTKSTYAEAYLNDFQAPPEEAIQAKLELVKDGKVVSNVILPKYHFAYMNPFMEIDDFALYGKHPEYPEVDWGDIGYQYFALYTNDPNATYGMLEIYDSDFLDSLPGSDDTIDAPEGCYIQVSYGLRASDHTGDKEYVQDIDKSLSKIADMVEAKEPILNPNRIDPIYVDFYARYDNFELKKWVVNSTKTIDDIATKDEPNSTFIRPVIARLFKQKFSIYNEGGSGNEKYAFYQMVSSFQTKCISRHSEEMGNEYTFVFIGFKASEIPFETKWPNKTEYVDPERIVITLDKDGAHLKTE